MKWTKVSGRWPIVLICALAIALALSAAQRAVASAPALSSGDTFLNFQGDPAHDGVVPDDSIRPPLVRKWSVYLPLPQTDPQVSFPVIVGGRVFVTAWSRGGENYAYALDLRTGKIDWGPRDIGAAGHWTSLSYERGTLFVTNTDGDLMALDPASGAILWVDAGVAVDDSPTATGGVLYTGPDLQAFNEATGQLDWWDNTSGTTGDPAVAGGRVYTAGRGRQPDRRHPGGKALVAIPGARYRGHRGDAGRLRRSGVPAQPHRRPHKRLPRMGPRRLHRRANREL